MNDGASPDLTMLFTDIEGSTRLLNRLGGPAYADVLAAHRRILRAAFARVGGRELGTEGDSFFVVFASATDAVTAAAEGQRGLESQPWPDGATLRVRMGLHTGHPESFEDNLVGLDVHLAARVSAAAHGGQVVLSAITAALVADRLPPGSSLLDLGTHRLKDIPGPQRLYQLTVPGLPHTFPALRSLGAPASLPVAPTPLVGRDAELSALTSMLASGETRLVTLTGPGGAGKTRLALAAADRLASDYPDGVHFVDLTAATDGGIAWTTIGETVGRTDEAHGELLEHLCDRRMLLVLDNLEQLPESGAPVVLELLAAAGRTTVLATSRRPLRVVGEQEYPVPPLGLPADDRTVDVETAERAESVRLFVQQARLSDPRFALDAANVAEVVAICRRLDGLPLAVELAASRVRLLPPRELLEHMDEALGLPLGGHPERQQTMTATVDWSYRMVAAEEQRAFRALGVFGSAGGTFDAVAAVLDVSSALGLVAGLLDAALVRVDDDAAGTRARLLQTIRSVAVDLAVRAGEIDDLMARHAQHYVGVAERASPRLRGPDAMAARAQLELEMDNLRAALDWSLGGEDGETPQAEDRVATGIRLCTALGWYWYRTGYDAESRRWLERATRAAAGQQGPQLAQLLHTFALLLLQQGDLAAGRDMLAKSLLLWRRAGDRTGEAVALNSLGVAYRSLGEPSRARRLLKESAELARALGNQQRRATALSNLALLEIDSGHPDDALPLLTEAEEIDLSTGNAWGVAADQANRAAALVAVDRFDEAAQVLRGLAASVTEHGDPDLSLGVVELLAVTAAANGHHARAIRLAACAAEQRRIADIPLVEPDLEFLEKHLMASRAALGASAEQAEREGRALDVDEALAEATDIGSP